MIATRPGNVTRPPAVLRRIVAGALLLLAMLTAAGWLFCRFRSAVAQHVAETPAEVRVRTFWLADGRLSLLTGSNANTGPGWRSAVGRPRTLEVEHGGDFWSPVRPYSLELTTAELSVSLVWLAGGVGLAGVFLWRRGWRRCVFSLYLLTLAALALATLHQHLGNPRRGLAEFGDGMHWLRLGKTLSYQRDAAPHFYLFADAASVGGKWWHLVGWQSGSASNVSFQYGAAVDSRLLAGGCAVLLTFHVWRWRNRRRVRGLVNTCAQCGYDLRATPQRCPECGAGVRVAGVTPSPA